MIKAYMSLRENEEEAIAIIDEIKNNPDFEEFIQQEQIDRILSQINIKLGNMAPDFTIDLLSGETIKLSDYSGKFVFLDFWGSWCPPCRKEIPHLLNFYNSTSRENVVVLGLATRDENDNRNFIKEQNINYPNAMASNGLLSKYNVNSFPSSFLINPKGRIVRMNIRGESQYELIKEDIENYFK